uniref:Uncharacterized protein n=1 Tax=Anguilla anguilla TaxID=7936 RepID=A0A0E9PX65_ANGAN
MSYCKWTLKKDYLFH